MLVYRVEHADDGTGPYKPYHGAVSNALCMAHMDSKHPVAGEDGIDPYELPDGWVFACTSAYALVGWFAGFGDRLSRSGFVVRVYRARPESLLIGASGAQCAFDRAAATLAATVDCGIIDRTAGRAVQ